MPILKNERHELFAQKLAEGKTATEAYELAGFKPSRKNASRLRANEDIGARVLEIQGAGAKSAEISVASLIEELEAARVKATNLNQLSAAVRATAEKARISGLLIERQQVEVIDAAPFAEAQCAEDVLRKVAAELGLETARILAQAFRIEFDEAVILAPAPSANSSQRALDCRPPRKPAKREL